MADSTPIHADVGFNALPLAVRTRFAELIQAPGAEGPYFQIPWRGHGWGIALLLLGIAATAGVVALATTDWLMPVDAMVPIGITLAVAMIGLLLILRVRTVRRCYGFWPGTYAFASDIVETRGTGLRLWPVAAIKTFKAVHQHNNGIYTGTAITAKFPGLMGKRFVFTVMGKQKAEEALAQFNQASAYFQQALAARDAAALAQVDVFCELRLRSSWSAAQMSVPLPATGPRVEPLPGLYRNSWTLLGAAMLAGAVLTAPLWALTNLVNDERFIAHARATNLVSVWRDYSRNGLRHKDEAAVALPLAAYAEAHAARSVVALRSFRSSYPDHPKAALVGPEIHALYVEALERMRAKADAPALRYLEQLFAHLESNGTPEVTVRFDAPSAESLARADTEIQEKGGKIDGLLVAPVSPSFTDEASRQRETLIVQSLNRGFHSVVPAEIITLRHGARLQGNPQPGDAGIFIAYGVAPSGSLYINEEKTRGFVGISVGFMVVMMAPGGTEPYSIPLEVEPPEQFIVPARGRNANPSDSQVYDVMAQEAFKKLDHTLRKTFFNPPEVGKESGT